MMPPDEEKREVGIGREGSTRSPYTHQFLWLLIICTLTIFLAVIQTSAQPDIFPQAYQVTPEWKAHLPMVLEKYPPRLIAFEGYTPGNLDLFIIDSAGQNTTNLTDNPAVEGPPAVSPDGTRIAFEQDDDALPGFLHPILHLQHLDLQVLLDGLVLLPVHLGRVGVIGIREDLSFAELFDRFGFG